MLKALVHREQGIEFGLGQRQVTLVPGYWAAIGNAKGSALGSVVCRPSKQNEELRGRQLRTMSMRLLIPLVAACLCVCPTLPQLNQPLTAFRGVVLACVPAAETSATRIKQAARIAVV